MTEQLATETPPVDPAVLTAGDPPSVDPPQPEPEPAPRTIPVETFTREVTPLRAKVRDLELAREEDRRKLAEANELIARFQRPANGSEPPQPSAPPRQTEVTQADIDRRALELNFQRDAQSVSEAGARAYGARWGDSVNILQSFGLNGADFIASIMEVTGRDKSHEVVHEIAQKPEIAAALASMSPARRIAEITRISERMTVKPAVPPAAAPPSPPPKTVSSAPPPAPRVESNARKVLDWATEQDKMNDQEWSRNWEERQKSRSGARR